jgi:hypothetical protein
MHLWGTFNFPVQARLVLAVKDILSLCPQFDGIAFRIVVAWSWIWVI